MAAEVVAVLVGTVAVVVLEDTRTAIRSGCATDRIDARTA